MRTVIAGAVLVLALTGCSASTSGTPKASTPPPAPSTSDSSQPATGTLTTSAVQSDLSPSDSPSPTLSPDPQADAHLTNLLYSGKFSGEYYSQPMSAWISIAHTACDKLRSGEGTVPDILSILQEQLSHDAANFYLAAVITLYCPDQQVSNN